MNNKERQETIKRLKARLECGRRTVSGRAECAYELCEDCNLCYEQGNLGERNIDLERAIEALKTNAIPVIWLINKAYELSVHKDISPLAIHLALRDWRKENEQV